MATALIVDDSNLIRMRLKALLTQMGHDVVAEASNGLEGVKKFSIHKPDLVTMDINMPEMNGLDALQEIRKKDPLASVVIVSTEGQESSIQQAIALGARYFIIKPFKTNQFANVIRAMLDNAGKAPDKSVENLEIDEDITGVVLTIDDSKTILEKLRTELKKDDHTVIQADSGKKGVEFAVSGSPDPILLDLVMPEMDGFDVLTELKKSEITRKIPVIILTGQTKKEDVLNAMKFGVVDYISKNTKDEDLRHKIKIALHNFKVTRGVAKDEDELPVVVKREEGRVTVVFREKLSSHETGEETQRLFSRSFLTMIQGDVVIFDLRMVPDMEKADLGFLVEIMFLLKDNSIYIVAGKHYGYLVSETNLEDSAPLFISHGDLELYLEENPPS